jgi:hypothetical protein
MFTREELLLRRPSGSESVSPSGRPSTALLFGGELVAVREAWAVCSRSWFFFSACSEFALLRREEGAWASGFLVCLVSFHPRALLPRYRQKGRRWALVVSAAKGCRRGRRQGGCQSDQSQRPGRGEAAARSCSGGTEQSTSGDLELWGP